MDRQADRAVGRDPAKVSGILREIAGLDAGERLELTLSLLLNAREDDPEFADQIDRLPSHVVWKPTLDL